MQLNLVDGAYTPQQAEELIRQLVKVKTDFHLHNIDSAAQSEEDIKHSERRIKALEQDLRDALAEIRSIGDSSLISMHASIAIAATRPAAVSL